MSYFCDKFSNKHTFSIPASSNQDKGKSWEKDGVTFFAVCDGHGDNGHDYANFVINFLFDNFSLVNLQIEDLTEIINNIIDNLENECKKQIGHLIGGTTLSLIIQTKDYNWIVNIGDSDIVHFDCVKKNYTILSEDHSPDNISEFKRIISKNKDTVFEYGKSYDDKNTYSLYEKEKDEWIKKKVPPNIPKKNVEGKYAYYIGNGIQDRLAMTRSIGDFGYKEKYGVSYKPYITKIPKLEKGCSLIVATDGFWDCWKYDEILSVIVNGRVLKMKEYHDIRSKQVFGNSRDDSLFYYVEFEH
jgi:serine/threonine protein phosphatase PrpC